MQHDDIRHRFRWQFKTGPGVDNSVPDSWLSAIFSLCANVDVLIQGELCEGFHWLDIKEKHGMLSVSYTAPAALTDAIDALVEAAGTACRQTVPAAAPATGILLRQVDSLNWSGQAVAAWLPVDGLGKPLSGAIITSRICRPRYRLISWRGWSSSHCPFRARRLACQDMGKPTLQRTY
ncbi:TPA: hypothetical protein L6H78_004773 [Salmonella enterica subsp. enterica serovar Infantis]|nr:hypothetical protein [Salmonella enterica subsp. enterica serovar Infantis]